MNETIQARTERLSGPNVYLFTYNLHITATADRIVSDKALHWLGKTITEVGDAWVRTLPRKKEKKK